MMRPMLALAVLLLAGCDKTPASLGITGPAPPPAPPVIDDSTIMNPGVPDAGHSYGPSIGPALQNGPYYNYN